MLLRIWIVIIAVVSGNSLTLYKSLGLEGNELDQFYRFENLTKQYGDYLVSGDDCSNTFNHNPNKDREMRRGCITELFDQKTSKYKRENLWNRKILGISVSNDTYVHRVAQDCKYNVATGSILYSPENGLLVELMVQQANCSSTTKILGGASFYVIAKNDRFLVTCGTDDLFNNFYRIKCYIPAVVHSKIYKSFCMNISISLLYEHFDGFNTDDDATQRYRNVSYILDVPITSEKRYCYPIINRNKKLISESNIVFLKWSDVIDVRYESKSVKSITGIWTRPEAATIPLYYYDLRHENTTSRDTLIKCVARTYIHIVGESHQRFVWDFLANKHFSDKYGSYLKRLSHQHADSSVSNFQYHAVYFIPEVVKYITSISCSSSDSNAVHFIQFGSWDLRDASVRYLMRNKNYIPALINALRTFYEKGCSERIKLVIILPLPYRRCLYPRNCFQFETMGRNTNPSSDTLSQYLIQEMSKFPSNHFDIIQTNSVLKGNLTGDVCGMHYLCRNVNKTIHNSQGGSAFVANILHAACR